MSTSWSARLFFWISSALFFLSIILFIIGAPYGLTVSVGVCIAIASVASLCCDVLFGRNW